MPFTGTNGRRIYDYLFVPVIRADGEVEAVAGTTRDVTDRKESELALAESDRKKDEFIALLAPIRNGLQVVRQARGQTVVERAQVMMDRQLASRSPMSYGRRYAASEWARRHAADSTGGRGQGREAGCDGHLVKPVSLAQLHQMLDALPR